MNFALAALLLATAAGPDLRIAVTPSEATVTAGKTVEHTITVTNAGSADVANVEVSDVVPVDTAFVSAKASAGKCTPDRSTAVVCQTGALAAGRTVTIVVTVRGAHAGTGAGSLIAAVPGSGYYPVGATYTTTVIAAKKQ